MVGTFSSFSQAAFSTYNPWLLWLYEVVWTTWPPAPRFTELSAEAAEWWWIIITTAEICLEINVQPLYKRFLNYLAHNNLLARASLQKGIATPSTNKNEISFLVPNASLQLWGTRREARWNFALPRHDMCLAKRITWCLKGVQQCKQSPCSKQNHSGPAQGFTITSTVPYANILLLAVRLVPAKLRVQIEFPLTRTQVSRPQNLKLNLHHKRFSHTINCHAKPIYCMCTEINTQAM